MLAPFELSSNREGAEARAHARFFFDSDLDAAAAVAHELRGPLQALTLSCEVMLEDISALDAKQIQDLALGIRRRVSWLQGLVDTLAPAPPALASSGANGLTSAVRSARSLTLGEVLDDVDQLVEPLLRRRGQQLHVWQPGPVVTLAGDPRQIGQVLVNLIANASKFGPAGSAIDLFVAPLDGAVRLTVVDRGPGIAPAVLSDGGPDRLFEPFYRAPDQTLATSEGTGLGLAISKALVEARGGRIGAENHPGGGAAFWVELPLAPLAAPARATQPSAWPEIQPTSTASAVLTDALLQNARKASGESLSR